MSLCYRKVSFSLRSPPKITVAYFSSFVLSNCVTFDSITKIKHFPFVLTNKFLKIYNLVETRKKHTYLDLRDNALLCM